MKGSVCNFCQLLAYGALVVLMLGCSALNNAQPLNENFSGTLYQKQLIDAVRQGDASRVEKILKQGVDPNCEDEAGIPVLHIAIERRSWRILKLLLRFGADVNGRSGNGMPALCYAAFSSDLRIVKYLLSKGADVNARATGTLVTALMAAASGSDSVRVLGFEGSASRRRDDLLVAEVFIRAGAEVNAIDQMGDTALDKAEATLEVAPGHRLMVDLLRKYGGKRGVDLR
jgi:ankyrin repeat protein